MYSSTLSSTSALGGVGGQRHAPAVLPPGKTRYPLCKRLDEPRGRSGQVRKISPHTEIRSTDRPARSESLYRLSYPGPRHKTVSMENAQNISKKNAIERRRWLSRDIGLGSSGPVKTRRMG